MLASGAFLLVAIGVTLTLIAISTPGYADGGSSNPILQVLLRETPTPVPTPVVAACDVRMMQHAIVATDTASIELQNEGAAATVQAVTLVWPKVNGALTEVRLGSKTIWSGVEPGGSTTIFPNLAEILPTIKTGERTSLTLRFADGVVEGHYLTLLHLGKSCYALFEFGGDQTIDRTGSCLLTFDHFDVGEQVATLLVRNTTESLLTPSRLIIFWDDARAPIAAIELDERSIGEGPFVASPAIVSVDSGVTLHPGQVMRLNLMFDGSAPLIGYTVLLQTDECQSVFSNAKPLSACPVHQEGDFVTAGQVAGLALQNLGEVSQPIEGLWLAFPETNGALVDVTLDNVSVIDQSSGRFPKVSSPVTMVTGVDLLPGLSLLPNSQSILGFIFEQEASSQHYAVEVNLPDECRVLTTTRTDDPVPCRVQLDGDNPIRTDGNSVWLSVRNAGSVPAELRALTIDWDNRINGALTEVALRDAIFWQGERIGGTATVTHNTDNIVPVIEPEQSIDLRLTFRHEVVSYPYAFRLDFAEGCQLSYATQSGLGTPTPVMFRGVIDRLPDDAFNGTWWIKLSEGEVLSVQVTSQTVIVPSGLTPRKGDVVLVRALPAGDGEDEYLATYIRVTPNVVQPIQLTGLIEQVDAEQPIGYIIVQGHWVDIVPGETDVQGQLQTGWHAEIEGDLRADGSILAHSIRTTEPEADFQRVNFQGFVQEWMRISEVETLWKVSGLDVIVHEVNTIHHGIEPGQEPELGVEVQIDGIQESARRVRARELWYGPGAEVQEFSGVIQELPDDEQFRGMWMVEDNADGTQKSVLVTESTFLDMSEATPAIGASVRARARQNPNGSLEALWIKVLIDE